MFGLLSSPDGGFEIQAKEGGVDAVLLRPFRRSALIDAVKDALFRRGVRAESEILAEAKVGMAGARALVSDCSASLL